jgi:multidrug efflux system outer membrane protein
MSSRLSMIIVVVALTVAAPLHAITRLSLAEAVNIARCRRSEIVLADLDVQLSQLNVLRAGLERVHLTVTTSFNEQYENLNIGAPPDVCGAYEGGDKNNKNNDACFGGESHIFNAEAALVVPVWTGLSVEADLARAKALRRAAHADREARLRLLTREVTSAYWAVRRAEMLLELGRGALKRNEEIAGLVKQRVDRGIVSLVDYNRAQTVVLNERNELLGIEEKVEAARAELAATLQIDDTIELTDQPPLEGPQLPRLENLLTEAQQARPEIKRVQAELEAEKQHVRSVQGQLWPQVNLFANANVSNSALGLPQPSMIGNITTGVGVSWTVFDMLTTWNNVREARLGEARAVAERARIDYTVRAEVRVAYVRLQKSIERRDSILRALALSQNTTDLIKKRYLTGTALLLEVLSAEAELLHLESEAADNLVEIADSRAQLWQASGQP